MVNSSSSKSFHTRRAGGFTLVELSIVLVIIGLIIGGIVVGQDLVKTATLRSVVKQQEQFKTAVADFRDKYSCLPGDCPTATIYGFTVNGDGNGMIGDVTGFLFNALNGEQLYFWKHLFQAGLISTDATAANPAGSVPAKIRADTWWAGYSAHGYTGWPGYASGPLGNILALVGVPGQCGFGTCGGAAFSEGISPVEAQYMDSKIDDGMPNTGNVQAASSGNWIDSSAFSTDGGWTSIPNECVNGSDSSPTSPYGSPANYTTHCNLLFKLGF